MRRVAYHSLSNKRAGLNLGTGTGALALAAARRHAAPVTAVDLSLRSVPAGWLNSRLPGPCEGHCDDLGRDPRC
jgi:methylase of polypeptide subunit release factors